jgi:predicted nucleic-acid-binding protein
MKALDTNVLVRYLVQDDPNQSRRATLFIERAAAGGERLLIDAIVLCELAWVLDAAYGYPKANLADAVEAILLTAQFEVDEKDTAWAALADYRNSRADFADCLIGRVNQSRGCDTTVTFDKSLKTLPAFEML